MQTASSANRTCRAFRSASEYTATVRTPSSRHARMMRSAISPRFAMRTFWNIGTAGSDDTEEGLPELHGLSILDEDLRDLPAEFGVDLVHHLHRPRMHRQSPAATVSPTSTRAVRASLIGRSWRPWAPSRCGLPTQFPRQAPQHPSRPQAPRRLQSHRNRCPRHTQEHGHPLFEFHLGEAVLVISPIKDSIRSRSMNPPCTVSPCLPGPAGVHQR